jgi:hypothetical protein
MPCTHSWLLSNILLDSRFLHNLPVGIGGSDVGHSTNAIDDVPEPPDVLVLVKGFGVLNILDCKGLGSHESRVTTVITI